MTELHRALRRARHRLRPSRRSPTTRSSMPGPSSTSSATGCSTLDIVCHSRGGLVARSITERPGDLAPARRPTCTSDRSRWSGCSTPGRSSPTRPTGVSCSIGSRRCSGCCPRPGVVDDPRDGPGRRQGASPWRSPRSSRGCRRWLPGSEFLRPPQHRAGPRRRTRRYRAIGVQLRADRSGPQGLAQRRGPRRALRRAAERHDGDHRQHDRRQRLGPVPDRGGRHPRLRAPRRPSSTPTTSASRRPRSGCSAG